MSRYSRSLVTIGAVGAVLATAGCGSGGSGGDTAAPTAGAETELAAATGTVDSVTWGYAGMLRTLDPAHSAAFDAGEVIANVCEPMLRLQPDFSVADGLVSIDNPDPTTYTLTVRDGATFTDGQPVTAADVAYSIDRQRDPATASDWAGLFSRVTAVQAEGSTVTLTTSEPDALIPQALASMGGAVVEQAATVAAGESFGAPGTGVVCAGPYEVQTWAAGEDVVLRANPDYWDTEHAPKVQTLTIQSVVDGGAQVNGLTTGSLQGMYNAPAEGVSTLRTASSGSLHTGASTTTFALQPVRADGPLADPRVREALSLALDRSALARSVFGDTAAAATHLWSAAAAGAAGSPEAVATYQDSEPQAWVTQDLDRARELLSEAGYGGETVRFIYTSGVSAAVGQIATYVQQAAAEIGMTIELDDVAPQVIGQLFTDAGTRAQYDLGFTFGAPTLPDPLQRAQALLPTNPFNFIGYDNATVTDLLTRAQSTTDPVQRAQMVLQAEQAAAPEAPIIPVLDISNLVFVGDGLTGIPLSSIQGQVAWASLLGATS